MKKEVLQNFLNKFGRPKKGCWNWTACKNQLGYGILTIKRRNHWAHRVSYEHFVGKIPKGLELDHLCRNPSCVNPKHLEPVTHRVNVLRGNAASAINARKTHCKRGHKFEGKNMMVIRTPFGKGRACRACYLKSNHEYIDRKNKLNPNISKSPLHRKRLSISLTNYYIKHPKL